MNSYIGIVGLGYVGLPLAICFGCKYPTIGFDIDKKRVKELKTKYDQTNEIDEKEFGKSKFLSFKSNQTISKYEVARPSILLHT